MSPLISRATDNLGLIFSLQLGGGGGGAGGGPVPVQDFFYDIDLFGEGFANSFVNNDLVYGPGDGFSSPSQSIIINNGGGYTKLRMKSLTSSDISFEPQLYLGGRCITTSSNFRSITYTNPSDGGSSTDIGTTPVDKKAAGDAAAFSIDGEWMGIAGGGSQSYYVYETTTRGDGNVNNTLFSAEILSLVPASGDPNDGGKGGFNLDNPSASPQNGANLTNPIRERSNSSQTFTRGVTGFDGTKLDETNVGGAGGAGAGPGLSRDSTTLTPSTGGGGNVRIWADTAGVGGIAAGKLNGNIDSVPGTEMEVLTGRNGTEIGESRVEITASNTGLGITYTTNNTLSLRELKALLDPELEFAFDVELYGEGLGDIGLSNSGDVGPGFTVGPVPSNSLKGGYTKLRMIAPSSASSISFLPQTYSGGAVTVTGPNIPRDPVTGAATYSIDGTSGFNEAFNAGAGAAFSIDGEWMGIAGGSGVVRYTADQTISVSGSTTREITIDPTDFPIVPGRGGVNSGNPKASPGRGGDVLSADNPVIFFAGTESAIQIFGGAGGGGAGGGPAANPGVSAAEGGGGNIRVYEQTDPPADTGDIFLPGIDPIYMRLEDSRDNFWLGASKVVVSHPITKVSLEYNTDTTLTRRELQALLIPTRDIIFDIELFGQGYNGETIQSLQFIGAGPTAGSTIVNATYDVVGGRGGYTKLRMTVPVSSTSNISLLPKFYRGGINTNDASRGNVGGNAAAFSIDGEWMAAAGGGVKGYYVVTDNYRIIDDGTGTGGTVKRGTETVTEPVNPTDATGKGGINTGNRTASPQNGGDFAGISNTSIFDTVLKEFRGSFPNNGGGGGGAGGGNGIVPPAGPTPGEGNIRVYAEKGTTEGELPTAVASAENILMKLTDSQDGFWLGNSKVVITNILTGDTTTFTNDTTLTTVELRNILYPGVFPTP